MATITLKPGSISLADLRRISRGSDAVALADGWRGPVEASLAALRARLAAGDSLYGINTGFGKLAQDPHLGRTSWQRCSATWCCSHAPASARCSPTRRCAWSWC